MPRGSYSEEGSVTSMHSNDYSNSLHADQPPSAKLDVDSGSHPTATSSLDMLAALASQVAEQQPDGVSEPEISMPSLLFGSQGNDRMSTHCLPQDSYGRSAFSGAIPWSTPAAAGMAPVTEYKCGYCGRVKTSTSTGMDGRVRIRCECGGKHQDKKPRMHAMWHRCTNRPLMDEPRSKRLCMDMSSQEIQVPFALGNGHSVDKTSFTKSSWQYRNFDTMAGVRDCVNYDAFLHERAFLELRKRANHIHALEGRRRQREGAAATCS
eukprot:TRINITY_DN23912_c0_g1_i2.p1 TRINITY_DN23912_c0_g1~~TRINITY_DN23912_c0_g1_i2.p1  ORF type:complete len:265 (-),score=35.21 TRINITY_DN23912_c0_g1_i2:381-1175(-)